MSDVSPSPSFYVNMKMMYDQGKKICASRKIELKGKINNVG